MVMSILAPRRYLNTTEFAALAQRLLRRSSRPHSVIPAIFVLSILLMALPGNYARGMGVFAVLIFDFVSVLSLIRHSDR